MKSFYVLFNGHRYLHSLEKFELYEDVHYYWHPSIVAAHRFESLCQALEFNGSSGLQLEVLRVDITSAWTPDLLNPTE